MMRTTDAHNEGNILEPHGACDMGNTVITEGCDDTVVIAVWDPVPNVPWGCGVTDI